METAPTESGRRHDEVNPAGMQDFEFVGNIKCNAEEDADFEGKKVSSLINFPLKTPFTHITKHTEEMPTLVNEHKTTLRATASHYSFSIESHLYIE